MRTIRKIALTILITVLTLTAGLVIYVWMNHDTIAKSMVDKVNKSLNTKISYGSLDVTVFESFPRITVRFRDLLIAPSRYYNRKHLSGEDNDTLLYASTLALSVDLPSLLSGTIALKSIAVRDGEMNILSDKNGNINYEVFFRKSESSHDVKLNNIILKNISTVYCDRQSSLRIEGIINETNISGEIFRSGIFINASLSAFIDETDIYNTKLKNIPAKADIRIRKTANSLSIARGSLDLGGMLFGVDGTVNYSTHTLDMVIRGRKIDISDLAAAVNDHIPALAKIKPQGIIDLSCIITGPYGEAGAPGFNLTFDLNHGILSNMAPGLDVNNLAFRGQVTNGESNGPETFLFTIDTLSASFGSAFFGGSFSLANLATPHVTLSLEGDLVFEDIRKIMRKDMIKDQEGSIRGSLKLEGVLPDSIRISLADLPALNPEANLTFSNFGASFGSNEVAVTDVSGTISLDEKLSTDSLSFTLLDQHFLVNAVALRFTEWFSGKPVTLEINGDVNADMFNPAAFTAGNNKVSTDGRKTPSLFPEDITMNLNLSADSLVNNDFGARNFSANLTYRPYIISFSGVKAEGLYGSLSGDLLIGKQKDGSYISKGKLTVSEIDITKTFSSFNDFGQKFIVSKNLSGRLTGSLTLLAPLDSTFKIITQTMVAEAHLSISNGHLMEFGPARSLSKFIDLDELENISFSKFENDLFIRNRNISIPKMLINSTAGNFTIYGSHSFDGDYTYHIRVLLSEVLSRQARERNRTDAAFGNVRVDGTGKATVPLKITCVNDKVSVTYDFGQAQDNIKENVADEKQTLKGILNEEYGWYKSDTLKKKEEEQKPKFRITWDEGKGDTTATLHADEGERPGTLRQLIKKLR